MAPEQIQIRQAGATTRNIIQTSVSRRDIN
uniref:Uncharacterized protein n=1 Tax=Arundo donax TaxID=35708 RepID=A0A0A9HSW9_ARUDO